MDAAAEPSPGDNPRRLILGGAATFLGVAALFMGPVAQPGAFHGFADARTIAGIPNALNVVSNLPFALVALWGSHVLHRARLAHPWLLWPYAALFTGVFLTTFGSTWYHLAPSNASLVWDRLPMTVGFMGLLAAILGERVHLGFARRAFPVLLLAGLASVIYWYRTDDLRPYALVQFGSLAIVVLTLALFPRADGSGRYFGGAIVLYGAAKLFEQADRAIFAMGGVVSGHTLKHLAAAGAVACLAAMLSRRAPESPARSRR